MMCSFRTEAHGHGVTVLHSRTLNLERDGQIVDMTYYDTGTRVNPCHMSHTVSSHVSQNFLNHVTYVTYSASHIS